jgi:hypothetical protein
MIKEKPLHVWQKQDEIYRKYVNSHRPVSIYNNNLSTNYGKMQEVAVPGKINTLRIFYFAL